jgi:hypothetical protein
MLSFMILAQPRSRTKWLAEYLSSYGARVEHDAALGCSSVDEYVNKISNLDGTVETSAVLGYRLWQNAFPRARFIVVHRTVLSVARSIEQLGLVPDWSFLYLQELMLGKFISQYKSIFFTFEGLSKFENRRRLCEFTIGSFDREHDELFAAKNIQIDAQERLKALEENSARFVSFHNDIAKKLVYLENNEKC